MTVLAAAAASSGSGAGVVVALLAVIALIVIFAAWRGRVVRRSRLRGTRDGVRIERPMADQGFVVQGAFAASQAEPAPETSAGLRVITAWLDQLARIQPDYGSLLQATTARVGLLPAVGDDGRIHTASSQGFYYAVGYATSLAGTLADRRRIDAALAKEKARKSGDETTSVTKGNESSFWADVKTFVESAGVAQMRPAQMPAWLLQTEPEYVP